MLLFVSVAHKKNGRPFRDGRTADGPGHHKGAVFLLQRISYTAVCLSANSISPIAVIIATYFSLSSNSLENVSCDS